MTSLSIVTGSRTHLLPLPTGAWWTPFLWSPDESLPDVGCYMRNDRGVIVAEVEVSQASYRLGQKAKPAVDCAVTVTPPRGYEIVADCARPWPSTHFPMHAAVRRFAFWPTSEPRLKALAMKLAAGVYAPWNPAEFGPTKMPLPKLSATQAQSAATKVSLWHGDLVTLLVSGHIGPIEDSQDGLLTPPVAGWRPWGIPERFAQGGSGIRFFTGWEQAPDGPAYNWLAAACNHERRWHAYSRDTGEVVTADAYGDPGPQYQECTGDPNNGWLPEFRGVATWPDPLLQPYDQGHLIRGCRHLIALCDMTDSPMARRMLKSQAAMFRLQFSEIGPHQGQSTYIPPSLRAYLATVKATPHVGAFGEDNGRRTGWPAFLIAASIKHGCAENVPWARMLIDYVTTASMPNGIFSRCMDQPGTVWYDPDSDTAQSMEVPICWGGVVACARTLAMPVPRPFLRAVQALYEEAPKLAYYPPNIGPPHFAYVAKRGGAPYASIPGGKADVTPPGDATNVHQLLALAISEALDKQRYLKDSAGVGSVFASWEAKRDWLTTIPDLSEYGWLLAQYQQQH